MGDLTLIKNTLSAEDRIAARIESFRREVMRGDGDVAYINEILDICFQYISQYEDEDIYMASIKIKEAVFYIDNFTNY